MNTISIKSDFLAARAKTAVTIMNATGWHEGVVNPSELGVDFVFFYVFDHQSRWTWCCSIPKDSFHAVLKQAQSVDQSESIAYCGQMIADCAACNGLNPDKENELAIALTIYIRITRTYQLTKLANTHNHFVVIRYGLTDTIRPFSLSGPPRHLIQASVIKGYLQKVIAIDLQNHPEWLA